MRSSSFRFRLRARRVAALAVSVLGLSVAVPLGLAGSPVASAAPSGHRVAPSATLTARLVTRSPAPVAAKPAVYTPRMVDPARSAREKAAANRAYRSWAARQARVAPGASGPLAITTLNKPGIAAGTPTTTSTPPDTTGAAGPANYLEFVNSDLGVYPRTLGSPTTVSEEAFVASSNTCDGQIKWDQAAQRYYYYSLDCGASPGTEGFSFGWSKTKSPLPVPTASSSGNWCRYHVGTGSSLEDYGKAGNYDSEYMFGVNTFSDSSGSYLGSNLLTFPKPANGVTTCPSESGHAFALADTFTPEPANLFGTSATGYVVGTKDNSTLTMYTVTGSGSTPTVTEAPLITVPAFSTPASVPQPGTTDKIDSSDTRLTQANAVKDPALKTFGVWTQHTIAGSGGGPSVVRWYELKAGQTSPVQSGTISVQGSFVFNGAISPTSVGNAAAIDYDVGSSTTNVQVRARIHPPGAAAGSMRSEQMLATSSGINQDFSCPSEGSGSSGCRWGDYAGASFDPLGCGNHVWGTNELNGPTSAGNASWATQNFELTVDECPTAAFTFSPTSPAHGTTVNFDGTGSSDPDGAITTYTWVWGDGTANGTGSNPTHVFAAAGTYNVALTVVDGNKLHARVVHPVTVS